MAINQTAQSAIDNVKWTGGGFIVITTSRSAKSNGNGPESAPGIWLQDISDWDQYYGPDGFLQIPFDLDTDGIRFTFPGNYPAPPKRKDLAAKLANGQDNPSGPTLRWGGFDQPSQGEVGQVGADRVKKPKPTLVGDPHPPSFEPDGYTSGMVIHDLVVLNVPAIKAITGKDDFTITIVTQTVEGPGGSDGGGGTPGIPTSRQLYFPWGSGGRLNVDIQPFDFPQFPPANGGTTGYPNYNGGHPNYKYKGIQTISNISTVQAWILNNINTGLPNATYPPWDSVGLPNGPGSQAIMQAQVDWANSTFAAEGETFFLGTGTEYFTPSPPVRQPEANFEITIGYYSKPPVNWPSTGSPSPNDPVPFFPVDPQNIPQWDLNKADQSAKRTFGGIAPQPGRSIKVKLARNPATGKQVLTAETTTINSP